MNAKAGPDTPTPCAPGGRPEDGPRTILVAEPDAKSRDRIEGLLAHRGYEVVGVADGQAALDELHTRHVDVVLLNFDLPKVSALNVLSARPAVGTDAKFVVMAAEGSVEAAVEAMKSGAYDFLQEPLTERDLMVVVEHAIEELARSRRTRPHGTARTGEELPRIVGRAAAMQRLCRLVERVAPTRANVLVTGETGTGKELVARAVHDLSHRASRPFVAVNCSAIPSTLLEAELFGHTRGSFTGAVQSRKGLIEEAAGGTLFLDEISTLTEDVQVKLLRVLEDRRVQRVGSNTPVSVDFRLVAATNTDLRGLVARGAFREDLFFRLDVFPIIVPPLRERADDIRLLAEHFTARFAAEHEVEAPRVTTQTLARMVAYEWPGNVRELENFIERSVIMYPGAEGFPFDLPRTRPEGESEVLLSRAVEEDWTLERLEREYLLATLERNHWRQGVAAEILGVNRRTIHRKLKRYREEGYLADVAEA